MRRILSARYAVIAATLLTAGLVARSSQACDAPGGYVDVYRPFTAYRAVEVVTPVVETYRVPVVERLRYEEPVEPQLAKVTVHEYKRVPEKKPEIAYDADGQPVIAYKTVYRIVKVPVTKLVRLSE